MVFQFTEIYWHISSAVISSRYHRRLLRLLLAHVQLLTMMLACFAGSSCGVSACRERPRRSTVWWSALRSATVTSIVGCSPLQVFKNPAPPLTVVCLIPVLRDHLSFQAYISEMYQFFCKDHVWLNYFWYAFRVVVTWQGTHNFAGKTSFDGEVVKGHN